MIVSSGPKKSRSKVFKIKAIVLKKKILAHFFPYYPLIPTSSTLLWGSTTYFRNFYASYKPLSSTTKRLLKTQIFEEKFKLSHEKNVLAFFSRTIEHDKRQETTYMVPQGSLLFTLEVIGSFLWGLTGWYEHNFLKKKGNLSSEEKISAYFLEIPSVTNLRGQITRVHKSLWQMLLKLQDHFCKTWEVVENTIFEKKAKFPVKKILAYLFRIFECDRPQQTFYRARQGMLTITVKVTRSFL